MLYSDETIQEVISSNDIVDVVSAYTQLKRSGRGYTGLCPFHNEKTPSFHVSADKQLYHCFGCGEGGTIVNFIMKAENLDFVEAIKLLADRAGIALPEPDVSGKETDKRHKQKQKNISANKLAAKFFYETLTGEGGQEGLRYFLEQRRFSKKTIVHFGLGFAPDSKDKLIRYLQQFGYEKSELVDFGLAIIKNNQYIDKFRNRVMFPIIDIRGNIIAFGGRVMDDSKPKYLNSPDTPAFNKSNNLFALNFAKNKTDQSIILAEGYMDVIALHQAGITNAVATLGTALTDAQAKIISRYANEVIICYDTDEAGVKATLRAINIFANTNLRVKVLTLTDAKDPDEFIKNNGGSSKFLQLMKNAPSATQYRLNLLKKDYDIENNTEDKIIFIKEAAKILLSTKNMIEIEAYAKQLERDYDIPKQSFIYEIDQMNKSTNRFNLSREGKRVALGKPYIEKKSELSKNKDEKKTRKNSNLINAEKRLLALVYNSKQAALTAKKSIPAEKFCLPIHSRLAQVCYELWEKGEQPEAAVILSAFSDEEASYITNILMDRSVYSDDLAAVKDLLRKIRLEQINDILKEEKDPNVLRSLLQEQLILKTGKESHPNE